MLAWDDDVSGGCAIPRHFGVPVPFRLRQCNTEHRGTEQQCQITREGSPVVGAAMARDGEPAVKAGVGTLNTSAGNDGEKGTDPDGSRLRKLSRHLSHPVPATSRPELPLPTRLLRLKAVKARCGLGRTTIYQRIKDGTFPPAVHIGARAVAWLESDIDRWIAQQVQLSGERA